MKKYILMSLAALLSVSFTSCSEENGTEPGGDANGVTTIFTYEVELPYNPDNDVALRMVGNNKVSEIYYLAEKESDYKANLASKGEAGYMDYVISNGTKANVNADVQKALGTVSSDVTLTGLVGSNIISVVSVSGGNKTLAKVQFVGLEWEDCTEGYYQFGSKSVLPSVSSLKGVSCKMQHCTTAGKTNIYRLVDVFGKGLNLKFSIMPETAEDTEYGKMWYCRVAAQPTSWNYGDYGTISVRDIAYWTGSDSYATNPSYGVTMYEDYYTEFCLQYFVEAGNLGYSYTGTADVFYPASYLE